MDFTKADGNVFPIGVNKGGPFFGFCPGKATWDHEAAHCLKLLDLAYYAGALAYPGSVYEQPAWYIDVVGELLPTYDQLRESQKAKMMWGGDTKKGGQGNASAKPRVPARRR